MHAAILVMVCHFILVIVIHSCNTKPPMHQENKANAKPPTQVSHRAKAPKTKDVKILIARLDICTPIEASSPIMHGLDHNNSFNLEAKHLVGAPLLFINCAKTAISRPKFHDSRIQCAFVEIRPITRCEIQFTISGLPKKKI